MLLIGTLMSVALLASASSAGDDAQQALWFKNERLVQQAPVVLEALRKADTYGLRSADYQLALSSAEINAVLAGQADPGGKRRFDAALSESASRFLRDLHGGRVDARRAGFHLPSPAHTFDVAQALRRLSSAQNVSAILSSIEPAPAPYKQLKAALGQYRLLAQRPELTRLPALPARSIGLGHSYPGAEQLRALLRAVGDLPLANSSEEPLAASLDPALVAAVRRFQHRHGLYADGVIGPRTFAAITTPLSQRVRQIELSMERWRWLTALDRPNIVVNIPQFMLFALPRGNTSTTDPLEMRVIVGETQPYTRTPIFVSSITQVIFQPYWDVPRSILVRELLPRIRADRSFLERNEMEIVQGQSDDARVVIPTARAIEDLAAGRLRLRQRPGPHNALGGVKFRMPNPYNVYLHATPEQALFDRAQRTFSHGCIRVSEPAELASYVLADAAETWDRKAIDAALCGKETLRVSLPNPVSVSVFYTTAVASRSEGVLFFDDIYGHDRKLQQLLEETSSTSR